MEGRAIAPLLDDISREYEARLKVAKLNVDEYPKTPSKYGIKGIPTLMIFKGGQVVDTRVGGMPKAQLSEWVEGNV